MVSKLGPPDVSLHPRLHQWETESTPVGHQCRLHLQFADQCTILPGSEAGVLWLHLWSPTPPPSPGVLHIETGHEKAYLSECAGELGRKYQKVPLRDDKTGVCSGAGAGQGPSRTWLATWATLRKKVYGANVPISSFFM